jgi:glycosyltransferase involved in cell wall biosynthesis
MTVDVLFCSWNRLAFTMASFEALLANTDWSLVRRLHVYDDGSIDGTLEYLAGRIHQCPGAYVLHEDENQGSPVATMNAYLAHADSDYFAKVDNDIAMPPHWLEDALERLAHLEEAGHPLDLLGLAAGWTGTNPGDALGYEPTTHIGGVGLMRTRAFAGRLPMRAEGRQGFTQWQHEHEPRAGWIVPDVQAVQLDLVPAEPWASLSASYIDLGWQRRWPPYDEHADHWKWVLRP